jgi:hypothetical protein
MVAREASLLPHAAAWQVLMAQMLLQNRFRETRKYALIWKIYVNFGISIAKSRGGL